MSASYRKVLLLSTILGLLVWGYGQVLTGTGIGPVNMTPGAGGRPPIIISDGSVFFDIDAPPASGGEWQPGVPGSDTEWFHDNSTGTLDNFVVTLTNTIHGPLNSANCQAAGHPFTVDSFQVKFKGAFSGGAVDVVKKNNHLYMTFNGASAKKQPNPHRLISEGFLHFRELAWVDLGGDKCHFAHDARIDVKQITH
jgi:hypothetical protein